MDMQNVMNNEELRTAIRETVSALRPSPLTPGVSGRTADQLQEHLEKLLRLEQARAAAVYIPPEKMKSIEE